MPRIPRECMAGAGSPPPDGTVGKAGGRGFEGLGPGIKGRSLRCAAALMHPQIHMAKP